MPYFQGNIVRCDIRIPLELYEKIEQLALTNGERINAKSGKVTVTPTIINLIEKGLGLADSLQIDRIPKSDNQIDFDLAKNFQEQLDTHLNIIDSLQNQLKALQDSTPGMNYKELTNYIQNTVKDCLSDNSQDISDINEELSDTNKEFNTEKVELCPSIYYERVMEGPPQQGDLIKVKIFNKTKKQLQEIRKTLSNKLKYYEAQIGLIKENYYSKDKEDKWILEIKCFDSRAISSLESIREDFYA